MPLQIRRRKPKNDYKRRVRSGYGALFEEMTLPLGKNRQRYGRIKIQFMKEENDMKQCKIIHINDGRAEEGKNGNF